MRCRHGEDLSRLANCIPRTQRSGAKRNNHNQPKPMSNETAKRNDQPDGERSCPAPASSVEGVIRYQKGEEATSCHCCDGVHIYRRWVEYDDWGSKAPKHFDRDEHQFMRDKILNVSESLEGRRVRITVELLPNVKDTREAEQTQPTDENQ